MKRFALILLLFTFAANINSYAASVDDSTFVEDIMKSYNRQRHRLERAVRRRVKDIKDDDTIDEK